MKVSSFMTKEVVSVSPSAKVAEIAKLLSEKGFNGVPVVQDGKVLGMITEADLISRGSGAVHIPSLVKFFHELGIEKYVTKEQKEDVLSVLEADAGSIMNKEYICVGPETLLTELIRLFREKHVNPIPVVDEEKNIVGIVSLSDIIGYVSRFTEAELDFLRKGE